MRSFIMFGLIACLVFGLNFVSVCEGSEIFPSFAGIALGDSKATVRSKCPQLERGEFFNISVANLSASASKFEETLRPPAAVRTRYGLEAMRGNCSVQDVVLRDMTLSFINDKLFHIQCVLSPEIGTGVAAEFESKYGDRLVKTGVTDKCNALFYSDAQTGVILVPPCFPPPPSLASWATITLYDVNIIKQLSQSSADAPHNQQKLDGDRRKRDIDRGRGLVK